MGNTEYYYVDHDTKECVFIGRTAREKAHAEETFPVYSHRVLPYRKAFMNYLTAKFVPDDWRIELGSKPEEPVERRIGSCPTCGKMKKLCKCFDIKVKTKPKPDPVTEVIAKVFPKRKRRNRIKVQLPRGKNIKRTIIGIAKDDGIAFALRVATGWKETAIAAMEGADPMQKELIKLALYNPTTEAIKALMNASEMLVNRKKKR